MPATNTAAPGLLDRVSTMAANLVKVTTTKAPIGQTPRQVIWTLNKATLFRYTPVVPAEKRHPIPLLLVFALMNKSAILDLRPGNSFVEFLLQKGYDVYLLDWGTPGPEDAQTSLGDYVLEYIPRAVRKLKSFSGSEQFNLLGWCIGAMLTTLYASLRPSEGLKSLILLTAPLDFTQHDKISLAKMTEERYFNVDRVLQAFGNMPAGLIDFGDVMTGWGEYDLLGPSAFMSAGMPRRVRSLFEGFGYSKADIDFTLKRRLMALLMLHRASDPIRHICIEGWQHKADDLLQLQELIWPS